MRRYGMLIKVRPEKLVDYKELHARPCQEPLPARKEGEWWAIMEEVFHCD